MTLLVPTSSPRAGDRLVTTQFVAISAATFALFTGIGVNLAILPRYVHDVLGGSNTDVMLLASAYSFAAIVVRPLLAWWGRRFGERSMMRWGAVLAAVGFALHPLAHSTWSLVPLRMIVGAGEALQWIGAATVVNELAPPSRRAEAASYFSVAVFSGLGLGPIAGTWFAHHDAHRAGFLTASALCVAAIVATVVVADRRVVHQTAEHRRLLHPAGLLTGLVLAMAMMGYAGWNNFLPLRADQLGGLSAGVLFAVYTALVLVLRLGGAKVPERIGLGRSSAVAMVIIAGAFGLMAVVPGMTGLFTGTVALAFGIALLYPALFALTVNAVTDSERTAVASTFTMFFEVGGLMGAGLGKVADVSGYRSAFGVSGLVAMGGFAVLIVAVLVPRRRGPDALDRRPHPAG